ncbi:MAG: glycine cleavage T C-terminal barrel domain-containing protein [Acidimicrobiales bacterium]
MIGYDELVNGVAAVRLERDVIRISGPDALSYLQGQLSQDVAALVPGASAWSLVLQPQGKVDAWIRVTRAGDDAFLCDLDAGFGEALGARLTRFKLRVKADIEMLEWECVALRGPGAVRPEPVGRDDGVVASADWPLIGGYDLLGPDVEVPDQMAAADDEAYEVRRIEAGLPRMGAELTDRTIPAEAGVVQCSVSFTKGCYTGQELVARIDSRGGHVPRLVRGVRIEGPLPSVGAVLEAGGREVGTLTSVAAHPRGHAVALAVVRRDVEPPAEATCGDARASIRTLPLTS